jgi:multidrug efflux pump subunit AcrB
MRKIVAYFVRYEILSNVLLFSVLGFGLIALSNMRYSFFPDIVPDNIIVRVPFLGASPEEVEEGVVLKVEEALDGLEGIERITSTAIENIGTITIEVEKEADFDEVLADVKNAVDSISSFPADTEKPVIFEVEFSSNIFDIVLYGDANLVDLKFLAENFRDELLATEEISKVELLGVPRREFSIELSEAAMRRYGLTFNEVARAVGNANVNISGGKLDTPEEEFLIRAEARRYQAEELRDIPIRGRQEGSVILLKDIAEVSEKWEDVPDRVFYNGNPAVVLDINRTEAENMLDVEAKARELLAKFEAQNPTLSAIITNDETEVVDQRLELLTRNGVIGLLLVLLVLGFFLNLRLAGWVSLGIPFSFAGMFVVAYLAGITINVITTFGMIIVIGILVDDAIVVGENIFAKYEEGMPPYKAAIEGTMEVMAPVTISVTTTMVAFMPFFFVDGFLGKFIWNMALVVIAVLVFSLIEAFFVLPAHLAHSKGLSPDQKQGKIRGGIESLINAFTHRFFAPILTWAMNHRAIILVTPLATIMLTIGLIRGGYIGATFFPFIDGNTFPINVSLVTGRQEYDTNEVLERIEKAAWEVNEELKQQRSDGRDVIEGIQRELGRNDFGQNGAHAGKLTVILLEGEVRDMFSYEVANLIREKASPIPEAENLSYAPVNVFGKPVSISLLGNDIDQLNKARDLLVAELKNFPELKDVTDSNQSGRRELKLELKPQAYALGLTLQDVAGQVRQGFFGSEVQRIQRGKDELRVWVRYREEDRAKLGQLDNMRIRTANGESYPLTEIATYDIERGLTRINRLEKRREIKVESDLADQNIDLPPLLAKVESQVLPIILSQVNGISYSMEGQSRDQKKTGESMGRAFPLAFITMFILVIIVFRSLGQAFLVFSLVPLSIIGAIWGHGIQGIQLNSLSIYGVIALSGIIINDSVVLIDQINRNLRKGQELFAAVHAATISRLRPILLTTVTTVAGLGPLLLEQSRQAQFLIPMAVSVAYGLLFGTFILLLVLPAGYLFFNDLRRIWNLDLSTWKRPSPETVEPAIREARDYNWEESQA